MVTGDRGEILRSHYTSLCQVSAQQGGVMQAHGQDYSCLQWHNCPEVMHSWIQVHW